MCSGIGLELPQLTWPQVHCEILAGGGPSLRLHRFGQNQSCSLMCRGVTALETSAPVVPRAPSQILGTACGAWRSPSTVLLPWHRAVPSASASEICTRMLLLLKCLREMNWMESCRKLSPRRIIISSEWDISVCVEMK